MSEDQIRAALAEQLERKDASPSSQSSTGPRKRPSWTRRASDDDLVSFYRQFAVLQESGHPLSRSLEVLGRTVRSPDLAETCRQLAATLETGRRLDDAMAEYPWYFSRATVAVVFAAHQAGSLTDALEYLAESSEHRSEIRQRIESALAYPVALLGVALTALFIIFYYVVPTFQASISQADLDAPQGLAALVIGFSNYVRAWYGIPSFVVVFAGLAYGLWFWRRTRPAETDRLLGRLPVLGRIFLLAHTSQFVDVLHMLLKHGVQLPQALPLATEGVNNAYLKIALDRSRAEVEAGRSMVKPLEDYPNLPPVFLEMLAVGEESGQLPMTLSHLGRFLRGRLTVAAHKLAVMLQPFMLLVGGVFVTFLVLAFFSTYFDVLMGLADHSRTTVGVAGE
jgi:type II secretory pathway component PulF